jgi:transcriptional regulator with GAF, ATPase, and Fis domain
VSDGGEDPGQRVLLDIAQQLASTRDLSALVPLVLERVVALLNAERAMFVLLDLDGQIDRAVTHNLPWPGPPAPLPIARSILDRVVREGKMIVASTVDDSAMGSTESMRRFGLRRVVAVPVLRGIVVLGVIYVDSTGRADGVHQQAETLRALASLVGVSVENARLFDELRYRRDLLAWMVHDLRNPITAVSLNAALLLERAEGDDRAMLSEVESAAERSARMIDWALTLDRIDDSTPAYAPWSMSLRALLARSVQEHGSLARQRGVTVTLPPLRARGDLVGLARHLLARLDAGASLHADAEAALRAHPWPGNVRELRSVLEVALALCDDGEIRASHLPLDVPAAQGDASPPTALAEVEGSVLRRVLGEVAGNVSAASKRLGVARSTLYRMMRRHGLEAPERS